jgi:exodeoxyribonuclease V beta subunit
MSPAGAPVATVAPAAAAAVAAVAEFDVFDCPLEGVQLIEASAGTGKTWNICALVLRLLLERGLEVSQILVVTFTHAATAELRDRIRRRIVETAAWLAQEAAGAPSAQGDPFVPRLVASLRRRALLDDELLRRRLELALAAFDEAAVFTIHGFCQRALADTPFAAGLPLAMELVEDDGELLREVANDFWRRRVACDAIEPGLAEAVAASRDRPERFARLLRRHLAKPTALAIWPAGIELPAPAELAALQAAHDDMRERWTDEGRREAVELVRGARKSLNGNTYREVSIDAAATQWDELLAEPDASAALAIAEDRAALFGATRLRQGTRNGGATPVHPLFDTAQALLDTRAAVRHGLALARLRLLREMLDDGARTLRQSKRARRVVAFDDMLRNLHDRLADGSAPWLAASLRARFPAALIDEFQDTDPLQFAIFDALYGDGKHPLFLVGDPKQAIYGFRHADLHTYLRARAQADRAYTLTANQRSDAALIEALNSLFGANGAAFMLPGLDYRRVAAGIRKPAPLVDRSEARAALQVWMLPAEHEPMRKATAEQAAQEACAGEVARLLTAAQAGDIRLGERALRAGDIAVLVRTHAEGRRMRMALAARGVASVELSRASVFASPDAEELERLLCAMLEPARDRLLKAALATQVMGLDATALDALGRDEPALLAVVQRFAAWRDTWVRRGIGVMLRQWLIDERVATRLVARPDGERRLTNLLHLAECLQRAAEDHATPDALLRWLQAERRASRKDDAIQLRLESDRHLVQIVTIHRAKGLEYPIVICPFLWKGGSGGAAAELDGVEYHDDEGRAVVDFRKGVDDGYDDKVVQRRRRLEASAETLRLVYVALTRAVHRCVLVAGCYQRPSGTGWSTAEGSRSVLNWLVAGEGLAPQAWLTQSRAPADIDAAWQALAASAAPHLQVAPLPRRAVAALAPQVVAPEQIAALPAPPRLPVPWRIGSYSSLRHGTAHEAAAVDHDLRVAESGESEEPLVSAAVEAAALADDDVLCFERGAAAGECIHSVFENADFTDPAGWDAVIATALRRHGPARAAKGRQYEAAMAAEATTTAATIPDRADSEGTSAAEARFALDARRLRRMLADVLATPLPVGTPSPLRLAELPPQRRLVELEFHLPARHLDAAALHATLERLGYALPPLAFAPLEGYLKGYVDLVVEHEGRHFVIDWKSNHLGERPADFGPGPLAAVMATQGYHLQYLIYAVALHRHLQQRLRGYRPERHFGGVAYLFVRGVRPGWIDAAGHPAGLYFHRPSTQALKTLSALFDAGNEAAAPGAGS